MPFPTQPTGSPTKSLPPSKSTTVSAFPTELWFEILKHLPLQHLWRNARPVCTLWAFIADDIARNQLYDGSECEISTLMHGVDGFKHYEREYLSPLKASSSRGTGECMDRIRRSQDENERPLIWLRHGMGMHQWSEFRTPEDIWPRIIQFRSANGMGINLRLNYDSHFFLSASHNFEDDGSFKTFSQLPGGPQLADWKIYCVQNEEMGSKAGLVATTIPLWQMVQLYLRGSQYHEDVEEIPVGVRDDNVTDAYYVWESEGEDDAEGNQDMTSQRTGMP